MRGRLDVGRTFKDLRDVLYTSVGYRPVAPDVTTRERDIVRHVGVPFVARRSRNNREDGDLCHCGLF